MPSTKTSVWAPYTVPTVRTLMRELWAPTEGWPEGEQLDMTASRARLVGGGRWPGGERSCSQGGLLMPGRKTLVL